MKNANVIGSCNTRQRVADVTKIEFSTTLEDSVAVDVCGVRGERLMGFWLCVDRNAFFAEAIKLLEENGYSISKK